jgi:hypothetical protein
LNIKEKKSKILYNGSKRNKLEDKLWNLPERIKRWTLERKKENYRITEKC